MGRIVPPLLLGLFLVAVPARAQSPDRFDHPRHAKLFPACVACHAGAARDGAALMPAGQGCASCHDGTIEPRVDWQPPAARTGNLRFTHTEHTREVISKAGRDSTLGCPACHTPEGASWMTVEPAVVPQCLTCHGVRAAHLAAPDTACAGCHLTLAEATALTRADVKAFPKPPSHDALGFMAAGGHGKLADAGTGPATFGVAPSCATCHARDYCIACHVNAPETPTIQALAEDARSLAIPVELDAPTSHAQGTFLLTHGKTARKSVTSCQACHTQQSCVVCHMSPPKPVAALHAAGPGRGAGARVVRSRPATHMADFSDIHAPVANSNQQSCQGCHTRPQCLDCHRGTSERTPQYHPQTFLQRHPAAAYARETNCSDCHNAAAFCQNCHVQAGLGSPKGALTAGYHDVFPGFLLNHGRAARQNLETCTSCHTEKDCLTCHSDVFGRGFSPHGPGFDAERLRRKNPQMCTACHSTSIPGGE
jgi:hypothetical protein